MIVLYQWEPCPYCKMVRDTLAELGLAYEVVEVPRERERREAVYQVSRQYTVPVLTDDEVVIVDEEMIIPYLEKKYPRR
ncbi:MAG TPA: glutaredoxin [Cyanobacteria bacterium UBA8530]|nr:glutaredoxin [Cyanobacteria bacterium UBA8530]